jgi:hypothetical protein
LDSPLKNSRAKVFSSLERLVKIRPIVAITPPAIEVSAMVVKIKDSTFEIAFRFSTDASLSEIE